MCNEDKVRCISIALNVLAAKSYFFFFFCPLDAPTPQRSSGAAIAYKTTRLCITQTICDHNALFVLNQFSNMIRNNDNPNLFVLVKKIDM